MFIRRVCHSRFWWGLPRRKQRRIARLPFISRLEPVRRNHQVIWSGKKKVPDGFLALFLPLFPERVHYYYSEMYRRLGCDEHRPCKSLFGFKRVLHHGRERWDVPAIRQISRGYQKIAITLSTAINVSGAWPMCLTDSSWTSWFILAPLLYWSTLRGLRVHTSGESPTSVTVPWQGDIRNTGLWIEIARRWW